MPKLSSLLSRLPSHSGDEQHQEEIWHHWTQETNQGYRKWQQIELIINRVDQRTINELEGELQKCQVRYSEDKDIIRWGYRPKGNFTTAEAHKIISSTTFPLDPIWGRIWSAGNWPKVSLFLWLVGHRKILTWDKLRRRNYHGPSICVNCKSQEETLQHLLDSCTLANQMWEKSSFRCQRKCRVSEDIIDSILQWHQSPYKSEVLNQLWRLIPGLLTRCIWKERNKRIFKDQTTRTEIIWSNFCLNLKETLALCTWTPDDFPTLANEKAIWANWNLPLQQGNPPQAHSKSNKGKKDIWTPPQKHTIKLNLD